MAKKVLKTRKSLEELEDKYFGYFLSGKWYCANKKNKRRQEYEEQVKKVIDKFNRDNQK